MGSFIKGLTVQNDSKIGLGADAYSDQYLKGSNQGLSNALAGQGQFTDNLAGQQALMQQYQNTANGQGANPAQQMLANQTGQNMQAQGAMMGSARGASVNPGLMARQVGMQGSNIQQQATGQAALMQAQQSLAAQQAMGGLYGQMGSQILGNTNANSGLFNIAANAQNNQNATQLGIQNSNAGIEQANANTAQGALSGLASGTGAAASSLTSGGGGSKKGMTGMAYGGEVEPMEQMPMQEEVPMAEPEVPQYSFASQFLAEPVTAPIESSEAPSLGATTTSTPQDSPFKKMIPGMGMMMSKGALVPGQASKAGDSKENDVVPAMLSPGEIVIPRSHAQDPERAAAFARAVAIRSRRGAK